MVGVQSAYKLQLYINLLAYLYFFVSRLEAHVLPISRFRGYVFFGGVGGAKENLVDHCTCLKELSSLILSLFTISNEGLRKLTFSTAPSSMSTISPSYDLFQ
jgi:hypothetical protein